jgi:hypothetical protein
MKRFLLLALTAGLLSPLAVKAESYWLVLEKAWGGYAALEKIEMIDMAQCKEQGEEYLKTSIAAGKKHRSYYCLKGK